VNILDQLEAAFSLADDWTWEVGRGRLTTETTAPIRQKAPYRANAHKSTDGRGIILHGWGDTPEEAIAWLLAKKP